MAKRKKDGACCPAEADIGCYRVEAIISVDERGQTVLPKDVRDKAGIKAGDKLAVVSLEKGGKTCCISLIRATDMEGMVKDMIGPLMKEV